MSSSVVSPEDVLETLMNDGTIDAIRLKIINQLKANEELKSTTVSMVEQSKVLNTPGAEKQTKRELFDALRQELETPVLEKASKAVWQLILDNNGLGKEISETVAKTFFRLSGQEPPQCLQVKSGDQSQHNENVNRQQRKEKEKCDAHLHHTENSDRQQRKDKEKADGQVHHTENADRQHRKDKEKCDTQVKHTENTNRQQRKEKEKGDGQAHHTDYTNRQHRKEKEKGDAQVQYTENTNKQHRKDKEKADAQVQHTENTHRQQRKEKERGDNQVQHTENSSRQQRKDKEKERASPASSSRKRTLDDTRTKEYDVREASVTSDSSDMWASKGKV